MRPIPLCAEAFRRLISRPFRPDKRSPLFATGLCLGAALAAGLLFQSPAAAALTLQETPSLAPQVKAGQLPPVAQRVPADPDIVVLNGKTRTYGTPGGTLHWLIGRDKDVRFVTVFGYARLVAYDRHFQLKPGILKSVEVKDGRIFTLHLRRAMKWSDGAPFTAEDFRYWWEDIATNKDLSPAGPPRELRVDGEWPTVSFPDALTVVYQWSHPNPNFLPRLAAAEPLYIYAPAHYLKAFNIKYADPAKLQAEVAAHHMMNWAALHNRVDSPYEASNPDLPTLDPWHVITRAPAQRFIAVRNPYYYRVDAQGHQLPYIDEIIMTPTAPNLIPTKAGSGETDLQARGLRFSNYTFLRANETRYHYRTLLWHTAKGSHFALYPDLTCTDPVWRKVMRDPRFRRALSLAIDRDAINQSFFFGLAITGNNTALPGSPLYTKQNLSEWANFDLPLANKLLDQIGLTKRDGDGYRLLPDGRRMTIPVETAGEDPGQVDILELIRDTWRKIGIELIPKPLQRDLLRNRVYSGATLMSVWTGFEDGLPTPDMSPAELAPTEQVSLEWPKWGQYYETNGAAGEKIDLPAAQNLMDLYRDWLNSTTEAERRQDWVKMLAIHADQQFTIGTIAGIEQPIVASDRLHNIPEKGIYNWDPGAFFGVYRPDTFWLTPGAS